MPSRVLFQRLEKLLSPKIRPERGCDDKFGIRSLPEEEIAQPLFSARANQQVRIRPFVRVKMLRDGRLINLRRFHIAITNLGCDAANRFDDFRAASVTERENEGQAIISSQRAFRFFELLLN